MYTFTSVVVVACRGGARRSKRCGGLKAGALLLSKSRV
jgi:hypothetical protein